MAVRLLERLKVLLVKRKVVYASSGTPVNVQSKSSQPMSSQCLSDFEIQYKTPVIRKQKVMPKAHYGGRHTVTMLPGGGIGPEVMGYVQEIFKYIGAPVDFEVVDIKPDVDSDEDLLYAINTIKRNGVGIKGNIETKSQAAYVTSRNVALHNDLDMYAYVLKCKSFPGVPTRHKNIDICVIRQNTEGEYSMLEHESVRGVVESMKIITKSNSERLARFAFQFAKRHGRKKITVVHKANIIKLSDGLFLETCRRIAKDYPDIAQDDMIIDNCSMQIVWKPQQFDILLTTNLYGSILNNIVCGLIGGAGLLSGKNYGDHYAVFEPGTRNTGTAIAGKNIANPIAMINASIDMLEHLGHHFHANLLTKAVHKTINVDKILTADLGGSSTTADVVNAILVNCKELVKKDS